MPFALRHSTGAQLLIDVVFYAAIVGAAIMAFSIGGNGAASSMASAYGAKALTMRQAVFVAAVANFVGAVFLGGAVTATVAGGIIDATEIPDANQLAVGMLSALLAAGLFVLVATIMGLPVATSQAIVGAIAGFGVLVAGWGVVYWDAMIVIIVAWVITPFVAAAMAWALVRFIRFSLKTESHRTKRIVEVVPIWMASVGMIVMIFVVEEMFPDTTVSLATIGLLLIAISTIVYVLGYRLMVDRHFVRRDDPEETIQESFKRLQIFTSGYLSLAHGANDVANAIGPVFAIYLLARQGVLSPDVEVPLWILLIGGIGLAAGVAGIAARVIRTVGEGITELENVRGFSADFTTASMLMVASHFGLPVSAAQTAVGAVTGTGLAHGKADLNARVLLRILASWLLTVPVAAVLSIAIYLLFEAILLPATTAVPA